jgi:hypothetical protein
LNSTNVSASDLSEWPISKKPFSSKGCCPAQFVIDLGARATDGAQFDIVQQYPASASDTGRCAQQIQ